MPDITTRLRQTRADMIGTDDEQHHCDCHDAAAEIERLRSSHATAVQRLAYEIGRLRLTDAEREAIERAADLIDSKTCGDPATLRGLLERTR
jgi:hypothetical protein